jgi:hypothetical protein
MKELIEEDHSLILPDTGFRIPLSLTGTFSFFPTTKPSVKDLIDPEEVYILTPATWDPHLDEYAMNEGSMLDWEGNLKTKKERECKVVLPPRVDHLDVVGRLTPSMKWKPRIHNVPLTYEPGWSASNETCARCHCNLN